MNLAAKILEVLQKKGNAEVPKLGVFFIQKKNAVLENNRLLPPGYEVTFSYQPELESAQLSKLTGISQEEILSQVSTWKQTLLEKNVLLAEGLGEFKQSENRIDFLGQSISQAPDFFGLEAIELAPEKEVEVVSAPSEPYKLNRSVLWLLLFIIPVAALVYFAATQRELLFGKRSFEPVTTSTHRIKEDSIKKDSLRKVIAQADSLRVDSIRTDSLRQDSVKNAALAASKWKSTKKYKNQRWRKAKQRRNP